MVSRWPRQYPVIWPAVWTGRFSSLYLFSSYFEDTSEYVASPFEVFLVNLLVCVFTGKMLVIICMIRRLSSVRTLEDLRYLLRACRQLGSRMKKSVVFVDVAGSVCVYSSVGGRRESW